MQFFRHWQWSLTVQRCMYQAIAADRSRTECVVKTSVTAKKLLGDSKNESYSGYPGPRLKHSVDAPFSSEVPPVSRNSSLSTATVSMLQRAELFHHHVSQQASESDAGLKQLPETKWGRCGRADCGYALSPHLYQSGPHGGEIRLLCSRFWKVNDGKRMRYFSKPWQPHPHGPEN